MANSLLGQQCPDMDMIRVLMPEKLGLWPLIDYAVTQHFVSQGTHGGQSAGLESARDWDFSSIYIITEVSPLVDGIAGLRPSALQFVLLASSLLHEKADAQSYEADKTEKYERWPGETSAVNERTHYNRPDECSETIKRKGEPDC